MATAEGGGGASVEEEMLNLASTGREAANAELRGEWMYGTQGKSYKISETADGQLRYDGPHMRVGSVHGVLRWRTGQMFEAVLYSLEGKFVGHIRLTVIEAGKTIISNFRSQAGSEWGKDIIALKGAPVSAEEFREQGNRYFHAGKHAFAIRAYSDTISVDSRDPKGWAKRAAAQIALLKSFGNNLSSAQIRVNPYYGSAVNDLDECVNLDSTYVKAWARKGQLHCLGGELEKALQAYEMGLSVDPQSAECSAGRDSCEKWL